MTGGRACSTARNEAALSTEATTPLQRIVCVCLCHSMPCACGTMHVTVRFTLLLATQYDVVRYLHIYSWFHKSEPKTGAGSAEQPTRRNNAVWLAVRPTRLGIPSYACSLVPSSTLETPFDSAFVLLASCEQMQSVQPHDSP